MLPNDAAVRSVGRCELSSRAVRKRLNLLGAHSRPDSRPESRLRHVGATLKGVWSPRESDGPTVENDWRESDEVKVSEFGRAYTAALLAGDEIAAEIAIREAMDAKLSTAEIDDEIIAPALWFLGALWERGEISVADEHIATEISLRVLALQREAQRVAGARGDHKVMLAAPAGELHVVALRMVDSSSRRRLRHRDAWRGQGLTLTNEPGACPRR